MLNDWPEYGLAPLPTPAEMATLDLKAQEVGIPGQVLMENAVRASVDLLKTRWPNLKSKVIYIVAGSGNNGGDAISMARQLSDLGARPLLFLLKPPASYRGEAKVELDIYLNLALPCFDIADLFSAEAGKPDILIDGILGTGFKGVLRDDLQQLIFKINDWGVKDVVAIDIPSGLDGQTGFPNPCAIYASLTICMHAQKLGLFYNHAKIYTGEVESVPIGIPRRVADEHRPKAYLLKPDILNLWDHYPSNSYKNFFGHVLVIGGSKLALIGAGHLAAYAALRAGAGLVTCLVPDALASSIRFNRPEIMVWPISGEYSSATINQEFKNRLKSFTSLVIGPGLGLDDQTADFLENLLSFPDRPPVVLDADALKLLAKHPKWSDYLKEFDILTPHPGEAAVLLGIKASQVQKNRFDVLLDLAQKYSAVCVLKGAETLITLGNGHIFVSPWDVPQLAVAGSGDVLAGLIAALIGQKHLLNYATLPGNTNPLTQHQLLAGLGVVVHALAGVRLAKKISGRGFLASEIADEIPHVLADNAKNDLSF